jgi:hypothetical protein
LLASVRRFYLSGAPDKTGPVACAATVAVLPTPEATKKSDVLTYFERAKNQSCSCVLRNNW